ncbi:DUF1338 domain-containing protein [Novosphingobium sp. PC22D]|uniref:2-oxoadipate dioxygenase/decarboxylase family protein n=1 Tax=Novosphingobium sp. PC22D TaxID=1962403 RepID=UPI000BEFBA6D|nr:DUF1338 family protein [Novosphingobium sp. PC22D]PEQ14087.1 DUF1338 domain-containing protein [Novosphingobium sp. PC22D]
MSYRNEGHVRALVRSVAGDAGADKLFAALAPMMPDGADAGNTISRAAFAAAMNVLLFADVLDRVPSGAAYVASTVAAGGTVCFDHGALRTIALPEGDTGGLPRGELAFRRILEPLGYEEAAQYPLPRLSMTGHAYSHREFPETIPQFFVSELHVDLFDGAFAEAAARVFGTSRDPLDAAARDLLARFAAGEPVDFASAAGAMPVILGAFGRQHDRPALGDYEILKRSSAEAAWIATEGNAFNHATDRVADVASLSEEQKALGRPIKERVEYSANGRVRQTAFRADMVEREFDVGEGETRRQIVPGSFYEFISRDVDPETGKLDLSFDSANATGIFAMTRAA